MGQRVTKYNFIGLYLNRNLNQNRIRNRSQSPNQRAENEFKCSEHASKLSSRNNLAFEKKKR